MTQCRGRYSLIFQRCLAITTYICMNPAVASIPCRPSIPPFKRIKSSWCVANSKDTTRVQKKRQKNKRHTNDGTVYLSQSWDKHRAFSLFLLYISILLSDYVSQHNLYWSEDNIIGPNIGITNPNISVTDANTDVTDPNTDVTDANTDVTDSNTENLGF